MSLSAIILTRDEEKNIEKCINSLRQLQITDIHVIDSFSTDRTPEIIKSLGVKLYQRGFDNHLNQVKYALKTCRFEHKYVLRIDADEELQWLSANIESSFEEIASINKSSKMLAGSGIRSYTFLGKVVNNMPVSNVSTIRIVNHRQFCMNGRSIDESFTADVVIPDTFSLVDNCNKGFCHFLYKHISYGKKHGQELYSNRINLLKNTNYRVYLKLPIIVRPIVLFLYYLIIKHGYRDGYRGVIYLFVQTLVLRMVADFTYLYMKVRK